MNTMYGDYEIWVWSDTIVGWESLKKVDIPNARAEFKAAVARYGTVMMFNKLMEVIASSKDGRVMIH